jgi:elongation factor P
MEIEDIHKNSKLLIEGIPYNVDEAEFMKPGKGRAIYRLKLRNMIDNGTVDRTFHSGEKVEEAQTGVLDAQYLYKEGDQYVFMHTQTFEQMYIDEALLEGKIEYLKEGMVVSILMFGEKPIDVTPPTFVELKVVASEVSTKTGTISPQMKAATMETGLTIGVPSFIKEGDMLKIDTRTGSYVERVVTKK